MRSCASFGIHRSHNLITSLLQMHVAKKEPCYNNDIEIYWAILRVFSSSFKVLQWENPTYISPGLGMRYYVVHLLWDFLVHWPVILVSFRGPASEDFANCRESSAICGIGAPGLATRSRDATIFLFLYFWFKNKPLETLFKRRVAMATGPYLPLKGEQVSI